MRYIKQRTNKGKGKKANKQPDKVTNQPNNEQADEGNKSRYLEMKKFDRHILPLATKTLASELDIFTKS